MSFGIEDSLPHPPAGCVTSEEASRHCGASVDEITLYEKEGLLVSLPSGNGIPYYTEHDYSWIHTIKRLRVEAHLSFDDIRHLLVSRCGCWQFRHCGFHKTEGCPIMTDTSRPCWANRAKLSVLVSHPCYSCVVYRSLSACAAVRAVLHGADSLPQAADHLHSV
ncbi:MAG TPA: MerR family transcriptional regulator [Terriglobales bacterium]|nr:MerR family transcriptional regulator [Terriglobales bacterium]